MANIEKRVKSVIMSKLGSKEEQLDSSMKLVNDLQADSLDIVELIMEIENEFKINIPDDAAEKIQTIGDIIEYIEANLKDQGYETDEESETDEKHETDKTPTKDDGYETGKDQEEDDLKNR